MTAKMDSYKNFYFVAAFSSQFFQETKVKQVWLWSFRKSNLKINLFCSLLFVILTYFQRIARVGDLKKVFLTVLAKLQLRPIKIELFGLVRREDLRLSEEQQRANWASSFFRTYGKMARE